jgi:dTDP-4-dehydrorhamnose reductase
MRAVVTGAGGLLAGAIVRRFRADAAVTPFDRQGLDITDAARCAEVVSRHQADVVINCAAYNDVDGAERDGPAALRANALGVRTLAAAARAAGAALVHFSSDFVFDGETDRPYTEEDRPNPRSTYGASKLLGEWFALEHPAAYVLRVESLFGTPAPGGSRQGSLGTIVRRIVEGEPVRVFVDRTVSPSYTADVAAATFELLARRAPPGLYHCVNSGAGTWAAIAAEAARLLNRPLHMEPITLETAGLVAPRPRYCALANARLAAAGIGMPDWRDALRRHLSETSASG